MKTLIETLEKLDNESRWDIDYFLPAEGIKKFSTEQLTTVSTMADVSKESRNPSDEEMFFYVDIAGVDPKVGVIINVQEVQGSEAPSRARMVIHSGDIIVSTVRPTRGATAVVPKNLDNQICSTGFCVLKVKEGVNPYYLHFVLRMNSTLEQFRKFATGSSYPAILDTDVMKAIVPSASLEEQVMIVTKIMRAYRKREEMIQQANIEFQTALDQSVAYLQNKK